MAASRRRKTNKKAESVGESSVNSSPRKNPLPQDVPESNSQIRVRQIDLWEIYNNRENAIQDWYNFMANNFGVIPDEIVVSKVTHNLMFSYLCARGIIAAGNWLGLELSVSHDPLFGVDNMMFCDQWTGAEITYGGREGEIIQFTERDILKRRKI